MLQNCAARRLSYSTRAAADYRGRIIEESIEGMLLSIDGTEVSVSFVGRFNVSNLLAVYGAALQLGFDRQDVLRVMSTLRPVNGRFEAITSPQGLSAVIDYAHTPDALANVLTAIREISRLGGKVITVCGAGGNRDKANAPSWRRKPCGRATASSSPPTTRATNSPKPSSAICWQASAPNSGRPSLPSPTAAKPYAPPSCWPRPAT